MHCYGAWENREGNGLFYTRAAVARIGNRSKGNRLLVFTGIIMGLSLMTTVLRENVQHTYTGCMAVFLAHMGRSSSTYIDE